MIASSSVLFALALAAVVPNVQAAYRLNKKWGPNDFLAGGWNFETAPDPTHGTVQYISQSEAQQRGLAKVQNGKFFMGADTTLTGARKSIRISTQQRWTDSVVILDLAHMPAGCGTWPAFWTLGASWPANGEVDILEGVNAGTQNAATLHTTPGCTMDVQRTQTGTSGQLDCNTQINGNTGCTVGFNEPNNYGAPFNQNGGGFYAMQRDVVGGIYVWFWPRNGNVPSDVRDGNAGNADPSKWGTPSAAFPTGHCNIGQHFGAHQLVFDLTFCGDWAGPAFAQTCPAITGTADCAGFVSNNPGRFTEAYWLVNNVRVYTF